MDDSSDDALHYGHNHFNELPVDKGRPPCPDIYMNPWYDFIEILNHRFIFKQGPELVDQVCKTGQNRFENALLLDPAVKLLFPEILRPLLDLIFPGYALMNIPPCQFSVNLAIIQLDSLYSLIASPRKYMCKAIHGEEGLGW